MNPAPVVTIEIRGRTHLDLSLRATYSASLLAAGVPFVVHGSVPPARPALSARLEAASGSLGWSLEVSASRCAVREDSSVRPALEATVGIQNVTLRLLAGTESSETEVAVVDPWYWPLDADCLPLAAGFVLPHDGVVTRLAADLSTRGPSLRGLFASLEQRTAITYAPPVVVRTSRGASLQVLRPAWAVFRDLPAAVGAGHCLDLCLLGAGVLEAARQAPLLVFVLDGHGFPIHTLLGSWRGAGRHFRPILRRAPLAEHIRAREVEVVDLVPICRDRSGSFPEAVAAARSWIEGAADLVAVDVGASRPPHGAIAPYELATEPVVLAAILDAEQTARASGSSLIETAHLLAALWRAGGAIGTALIEETATDPALEAAARLTAPAPTRRGGPPERTRGFQRCIAEAREIARAAGSTTVREADLWWAVLGGASASVARAFAGRPGRRQELVRALAALSPPVRPESEI